MNGDKTICAALFRDLRAFLNCMTNVCTECHRPRISCQECDLRVARGLLDRLCAARDANGVTVVEQMEKSLSVRRCARICDVLLSQNYPILAAQIDMCGLGNASNRKHALRSLARRGIVVIDRDPVGQCIYSIARGKAEIAKRIARYGH